MTLSVSVDAFSGPLDLLLSLIEKSEIDIYDIPIASLTDQYLEHMARMPEADMDQTAGFILMASTLLEIKSRMLLPSMRNDADEDEDPRDELVRKLIEFKKYKDFSGELTLRCKDPSEQRYRQSELNLYKTIAALDPDEPIAGLTAEALREAFEEAMRRREQKIDKVHSRYGAVYKDRFTVAEKLSLIKGILASRGRITFFALFSDDSTREELIATLLAVLEIVRGGGAYISQNGLFENMTITAKEESA
jgi:segregation and condensation protein A